MKLLVSHISPVTLLPSLPKISLKVYLRKNGYQNVFALFQVLVFLIAASATASPQGYNLRTPSGPSLLPKRCSAGQVLHVDGRCVTPRVNHRVYVYDIPSTPKVTGPPPYIPNPVVETNHLFIRTPEGGQSPDPIIVPPPTRQHIVYVLHKQSEQKQRVIEVPGQPPNDPEVYFVNYAEGENPVLPNGVDLQTALNAANQGNSHLFAADTSIKGFQESVGNFGTTGTFRANADVGRSADSRITNGGNGDFIGITGFGNGVISRTNGVFGVGGTSEKNAGLGSNVDSSINGVTGVTNDLRSNSRTNGGFGSLDSFIGSSLDSQPNGSLINAGSFRSNAALESTFDSRINGGIANFGTSTDLEIGNNFVGNTGPENNGNIGRSDSFGNTDDFVSTDDFQRTSNFGDNKRLGGTNIISVKSGLVNGADSTSGGGLESADIFGSNDARMSLGNKGDIGISIGTGNGVGVGVSGAEFESDILGKDLGFISVASDNGSSGSRTRSNSINDIINAPGASILSSLSGLYAVP